MRKNLVSPEKAVKAINEMCLMDVHAFKETGERISTYGGLNAIMAIREISRNLGLGRRVVITPRAAVPIGLTMNDQNDTNAYMLYLKYAINFGYYHTDDYSPRGSQISEGSAKQL